MVFSLPRRRGRGRQHNPLQHHRWVKFRFSSFRTNSFDLVLEWKLPRNYILPENSRTPTRGAHFAATPRSLIEQPWIVQNTEPFPAVATKISRSCVTNAKSSWQSIPIKILHPSSRKVVKVRWDTSPCYARTSPGRTNENISVSSMTKSSLPFRTLTTLYSRPMDSKASRHH